MSTVIVRLVALGLLALPAFGDERDDALALLERLHATSIEITAVDEPVAKAFDDIAAALDVPIRVDWDALESIGVRPRDTVRLRAEGLTGVNALRSVCLQLGDEYDRPWLDVANGSVLVTSRAAAVHHTVTGVYDVRDLIADDRAFGRLETAVPPERVAGAGGEEDAAGDGDPGPRVRTASERFAGLLMTHVDPQAWVDGGGALATCTERGGLLVVTAPPVIHRRLHETLDALRRAEVVSNIQLHAVMVETTPEALRGVERLPRDRVLFSRRLLDAEATRTRWETRGAVAVGHELHQDADAAGAGITLKVVPAFDRTLGVLTLDVEFTTTEGDDRRRLQTTVVVPFPDGAAAIEIPGARANDTSVRMLLLFPTR